MADVSSAHTFSLTPRGRTNPLQNHAICNEIDDLILAPDAETINPMLHQSLTLGQLRQIVRENQHLNPNVPVLISETQSNRLYKASSIGLRFGLFADSSASAILQSSTVPKDLIEDALRINRSRYRVAENVRQSTPKCVARCDYVPTSIMPYIRLNMQPANIS